MEEQSQLCRRPSNNKAQGAACGGNLSDSDKGEAVKAQVGGPGEGEGHGAQE
jgi:hypothetical protein